MGGGEPGHVSRFCAWPAITRAACIRDFETSADGSNPCRAHPPVADRSQPHCFYWCVIGSKLLHRLCGCAPRSVCRRCADVGEGEFRESLLRNLLHTAVFAVSGARDRNIRSIEGPRAMQRVLHQFEYDSKYHEEPERGHEGFQPLYPEILRWVQKRVRNPHPTLVLRVPHQGIMPTARRVHWLEVDTRHGLARGEITGNRIELTLRWVRQVKIFFNDHLIDLDLPVEVVINGEPVFTGKLERSIALGLEQARVLGDRGRAYSAERQFDVPVTPASRVIAQTWSDSLTSQQSAGPLSFWEHFAVATLRERRPDLGFDGIPKILNRDYGVVVVTSVTSAGLFQQAGGELGDRLLEFGGEPFKNGAALAQLYAWLERELTDLAATYPILIERDGRRLTLEVTLSLEPF